jgi:hypothetical protein
MDRAEMMAEWEPQQGLKTEMNEGLAAAFWAPRHMEILDTELWAIGLTLHMAIEKRETL